MQGQSNEVQVWLQKLEQVERQMKGLSSFAEHVEKFLAVKYSAAEGPTAPAGKGQERVSSRGNRGVTSERTSGASSSSTRPPSYIQVPAPPGIPAPPPGCISSITSSARSSSRRCDHVVSGSHFGRQQSRSRSRRLSSSLRRSRAVRAQSLISWR